MTSGTGWELDEPDVEEIVPGVWVVRFTCHQGMQDFYGERCPRCGWNVYDWLDWEDARSGTVMHGSES